MFSSRSLRVREKRPLPPLPPDYRRVTHSQATLSDDHSLFLLERLREGRGSSAGRFRRQRLLRFLRRLFRR
jgi:hypothetical protein